MLSIRAEKFGFICLKYFIMLIKKMRQAVEGLSCPFYQWLVFIIYFIIVKVEYDCSLRCLSHGGARSRQKVSRMLSCLNNQIQYPK